MIKKYFPFLIVVLLIIFVYMAADNDNLFLTAGKGGGKGGGGSGGGLLIPSSLSAQSTSDSTITLQWIDTNDSETGYEIERSVSSGSGFTLITSVPTDTTSYNDAGLNSATPYYYRARAFKIKGKKAPEFSAYSNSAQATTDASEPPPDTTPPSDPIGLSANAISTTQIDLSWDASSDNIGVIAYNIYRNASLLSSTGGTSYSDTGLSANTEYGYTVRALDAAGNISGHSTTASTSTLAPPDTTRPTISFTNPTDGTTVSGTIGIAADASDNVGVVGVQFYISGSMYGAEDTTAPYSVLWDTTTVGTTTTHLMYARARDAAGNIGFTPTITVFTTN